MLQAAPRSSHSLSGHWAFVDGSHRAGEMTYGVAIVRDGREIAALRGKVEDETTLFGADLPAILSSGARQIPGEITAVYKAVEWCRRHGVTQITIAHDLKGLAHWAQGTWKANTVITRRLRQDAPQWPVDIRWVKVKGHSNDPFNDRADQLAREALSSPEPTDGEGMDDEFGLEVQKGHAFCLHLSQVRIEAECMGMINRQHARVVIGERQGFVDIYQTRKRAWQDPYMHGFRQRSTKRRIEREWKAFVAA